MHNKILLIAIASSLVFFCLSSVQAGEASNAQLEEDLITMVNISRYDPLLVAEYLDLDKSELFSKISEDSQFWREHKAGLKQNESLSQAAEAHLADMLERDYVASNSPEGAGPERRAVEEGYPVVEAQEYVSAIASRNYLNPEEALKVLFTRFFESELEAYAKEKSSIFDHKFRELGVAYSSGNLTLEGKKRTVYLLVITYGLSEHSAMELALQNRINAARKDYSHFIDDYELDRQKISKEMNGFLLITLQKGLSGYPFIASLQDFSLIGLEQSVDDPDFYVMDEITLEENLDKQYDPESAAEALFESLLSLEDQKGVLAILNPRANFALLDISRTESSQDEFRLSVEFLVGRTGKTLSLNSPVAVD